MQQQVQRLYILAAGQRQHPLFGLQPGHARDFKTGVRGGRKCARGARIGLRRRGHVPLADRQFGAHPPGKRRVEPAGQALRQIVAAHAIGQRGHAIGVLDAAHVLLGQRRRQRLQRGVRRDVACARSGIGVASLPVQIERGEHGERAGGVAVHDIAHPGQRIGDQQPLRDGVIDQPAGAHWCRQRPACDEAQRRHAAT
ncbi:hypothetical protein G6F68_011602 [Rhizopus microsporus]|nr:hypothetical protein G6F68_011602 [Rhizopus microsporus]